MKKFYAILCLAIASLTQLQAQAPQGFNYQATVRGSGGDLIINTSVYFKFNLIQGSQTGVPIFTETHYVPTDDLGQVNLVIGQGTPSVGTFSELDWSQGSYYLGIELDTGSGYVAMGTTQLLSVPYALYAESSGNSTPTTPNLEAVLTENNSANNQQIKDLQDPTKPRLYNWYAVAGIHDTDPNTPDKEFAPEGWHVPTDTEWTTLGEHLIANGYNYDESTTENKIAKAMASTTGWLNSPNTGAIGNDQSLNNSSGFNAFPEGWRFNYGPFSIEGNFAFFWSSTEFNTNFVWSRYLINNIINLNNICKIFSCIN